MTTQVRWVLAQTFSLTITAFILFSLLSIYLGHAGRSHTFAVTAVLATAVGIRYAAVYHRFSRQSYKTLAVGILAVGLLAAGAVAAESIRTAVDFGALQSDLYRIPSDLGSGSLRSEHWMTLILLASAMATFVGSLTTRDLSPYPRASGLREVASSPPSFGVLCTFFGLWAVLFVGISLQRVLVIAPVFEELLKFGVALTVGSVLFDRSLLGRIGVALVVGSLFGWVEHATTYPTEDDAVYLFRTVFHATTTVLSVGTYTAFEAAREHRLQWIAPAYATLLHFFYNTFAVVSAVVGVSIYGSPVTVVTLAYGGAAILLATGLLLLSVFNRALLVSLHTPLKHVLSDLV